MIGSLRGKLISKHPYEIIIEVNGMGYLVNVSLNTLSELPDIGKDVFLYIHTHVREDALQLYGFLKEEEKRIFITLLGITGIGPKMALNILSGITYEDLYNAVEAEDIALLCRIPGLGKKTAQRLILELKEKIPHLEKVTDTVFNDTLSALVNLGYKRSIAKDALEKAYNKGYKEIELLIKEALKYLTSNKD
jgi:Holliday junction DNA helicase RuvA